MLTKQHIIDWVDALADRFQEKKDYLTELDTAIGDADHGNNMNRGFKKVKEKLPEFTDKDIAAILKMVAMTLISSVGGASGPLYGTLFLQGAGKVGEKEELSGEDILAFWEAGIDGVKKRGKAEVGEKTMIDALDPALATLRNALGDGATILEALQKATQSAKEGMESTIPLIARKGRASYLGERSKDHQDPGATSSYYLFELLAEIAAK